MNELKNELRRRIGRLHADNRKYGAKLKEVPRAYWPDNLTKNTSRAVVCVWRSREFLVIAYEEPSFMLRLTVCRTMIDKHGNYLAGISWDDLQRLKSEAGYGKYDAVEIYPRDDNVVNVSNMRHLWINLSSPNAVWFAWKDNADHP